MVQHRIADEVAVGPGPVGAAREGAQHDLGEREGEEDGEHDEEGKAATSRGGSRPATTGRGR